MNAHEAHTTVRVEIAVLIRKDHSDVNVIPDTLSTLSLIDVKVGIP